MTKILFWKTKNSFYKTIMWNSLTLSRRRGLSYRNQSNDLRSKSWTGFYMITASVLKGLTSFLANLKVQQQMQPSLIEGNVYRGDIIMHAVSNMENFQLNTFNKLNLFFDDCYIVLRICQIRFEDLLLTLNLINPSM